MGMVVVEGLTLNYVLAHRPNRPLLVLTHACIYTLVLKRKGLVCDQTKDIAHLFI